MPTSELHDFPWQELPKIELHAHLTGSISRHCLHGIWISKSASQLTTLIDPDLAMPAGKHDYNLESFFPLFTSYIYGLLDDLVSVRISTLAVLKDFARDGVSYLELRTTPRMSKNFTRAEYIQCIVHVVTEHNAKQGSDNSGRTGGMRVRLILSLDRRDTAEEAAITIALAKKYKGIVVGIDLCGTPTVRQGKAIDFFTPFMQEAREAGLGIVVHFGEVKHDTVCTAQSSIKKEIAQDGKPIVQPILPGGKVTAEEERKKREAEDRGQVVVRRHQRRCSMRQGELERMTVALAKETVEERKSLLAQRIHQVCVDEYMVAMGREPELKPGELMTEFRHGQVAGGEGKGWMLPEVVETKEERAERRRREDEELEIMLSWKPKRLGHVVYLSTRMVEKVLELRDEVTLEMCVTCNVMAKMTPGSSIWEHHFYYWWLDNMNVTLGTDDVGVFGSPLSHEYEIVGKNFRLTKSEIIKLARMGINGILGLKKDRDWLEKNMWTEKEVELGVDGVIKGISRVEVRPVGPHALGVAGLRAPFFQGGTMGIETGAGGRRAGQTGSSGMGIYG